MSTFYRHPEGETIIPYEIPVHIPPVGYVWDYFIGDWAPRPIHSRSEIPEDQYWERPVETFDYDRKRAVEKRKQGKNPIYVDPELDYFRYNEWDRRINGFWFMNNGKPTYITGLHYFYLTWWRIDIGYPSYRQSDRDFFYMWKYCEDDPKCFGLIEAARRRSGKALSIETEIPTPDGFVKMKDLQVGDSVFSHDGSVCKITYKSPTYLNNDCYNIVFNDKSSIIADADHQWEVTTKPDRKKFGITNTPKKVLTTKELIEGGVKYKKTNEYNYQIDIPEAIQYSEKDLTIDPYLFGCWLGDGGTHSPTITSVDDEIVDSFKCQYDVSTPKDDRITYYIKGIRKDLSDMGFMRSDTQKDNVRTYNKGINKSIPEIYKTSSIEQRTELLKGIMDTDGCFSSGGYELCVSNNKELANDYLELIRSLGIRVSLFENDSYLYEKYCGTRYRLYINTDKEIFKMNRKLDCVNIKKRVNNTHKVRRIVSIEKVDSVPTQCIEVDSDRSLYVAGRDYILTHNTYRATVLLFEEVSRREEANAGMQSKKDDDAAIVFGKLVQSFSNLPDFFKPNFNDRSGPKPKNKLEFSPVQKQIDDIKPELSGKIDYQANDILAYDSQKLIRYLNDECGKNIKSDVSIGWTIVRECLRLGVSQIVGKAFYTTTIEEGGSDNFRKLWDGSNFNEKDESTMGTSTGMYRTFTPAYKNVDDFVDKYGICDEAAAKEAMERERSAKKTNRERAEYIRKYPFTITEAFYSINENCIYDSLKINTQAKLLDVKGAAHWHTSGNLQWENGEIGNKVIFVPNINGRWKINNAFLMAEDATPGGLTNKFEKVGNQYKPLSDNTGITGADTFDHSLKNLTDERQASDAAFYTFWRHDPFAPELDDTFVCEYIYRQPDADLMAEDLAMQCLYFGTPAIIENNKPGAITWFVRNGLKPFIIKVDRREGISGTTKNKQSLAEVTEAYINENIHKVVFHKLLSDWNDFSLEKSTAYDAAMGSGWALLIATRIGKKFQQTPSHLQRKSDSVSNLYSKYL